MWHTVYCDDILFDKFTELYIKTAPSHRYTFEEIKINIQADEHVYVVEGVFDASEK